MLGLILVHPDLLSAYGYADAVNKGTVPTWNLFGWEIEKIGYQGQVPPVLVSAYLLAKMEIFLNKRVHDSIKLLVVAPVTLLITGFLAFTIIGPVTFAIANAITSGLIYVYNSYLCAGRFDLWWFVCTARYYGDAPHIPGGRRTADRQSRWYIPVADAGSVQHCTGFCGACDDAGLCVRKNARARGNLFRIRFSGGNRAGDLWCKYPLSISVYLRYDRFCHRWCLCLR